MVLLELQTMPLQAVWEVEVREAIHLQMVRLEQQTQAVAVEVAVGIAVSQAQTGALVVQA
jgi:hypothetical protein